MNKDPNIQPASQRAPQKISLLSVVRWYMHMPVVMVITIIMPLI